MRISTPNHLDREHLTGTVFLIRIHLHATRHVSSLFIKPELHSYQKGVCRQEMKNIINDKTSL